MAAGSQARRPEPGPEFVGAPGAQLRAPSAETKSGRSDGHRSPGVNPHSGRATRESSRPVSGVSGSGTERRGALGQWSCSLADANGSEVKRTVTSESGASALAPCGGSLREVSGPDAEAQTRKDEHRSRSGRRAHLTQSAAVFVPVSVCGSGRHPEPGPEFDGAPGAQAQAPSAEPNSGRGDGHRSQSQSTPRASWSSVIPAAQRRPRIRTVLLSSRG